MLTETDLQMLRIAYEEAKLGFDEGGCPIGSVLARGGEEVSRPQPARSAGRPDRAWRDGCLAQGWAAENLSRHRSLYDPQPV